MKALVSAGMFQNIQRAFRLGNVYMVMHHWQNNREAVILLGYAPTARLVAQCILALKYANERIDCDLRAELEFRQAGNAIAHLSQSQAVSPSLITTLEHKFHSAWARLNPDTVNADSFVVA